MVYTLRDYQQQSSDAAVRFFSDPNSSKHNGLIILPTGAGKSLVIADIASKIDEPLLVLQPSKEILEQNHAKLMSYGVWDCSIYSASLNRKEINRITFATIGSVMAHLDDFNVFHKILIDECHLVNPRGGQYKEFIEAVEGRQVIGLTATPYRLGQTIDPKTINSKWKKYGSILKFLTRTRPRVFDQVLYYCQVKTLLEGGFLAKLRYFDMNALELDRVKLNSTGADYDDKSLFKEFERVGFFEYTLNIVKRVMRPKDGSLRHGILVFCRFVEDAERLADELCGFCEVVSGATPKKEREAILERFKSGETEVVANVGVLTCLSNDTEILTRNGWKGVDTINENDLVAQYENEIVTFDKPLRIIKKKHSGDFVTVKGRYMNIRITDDHTMLYRKRARVGLGDERRAKAKDLVGQKVFIPLSGNCEPENIEPEQPSVLCSRRRFINYNAYNYRKKGLDHAAAEKKAAELYERRLRSTYKKPNELTLEECLFIGFWLGDGSSSGGRYSVTQSLGTPKMCEWIEDLLKDIGIHYTVKVYKGKETSILGRKAHVSGHKTFYFAKGTGGDGQEVETNLTRLLPYLKKGGTDLYWGLSKEQIFSLCKGLFMSDGWHGDNRQSNYVKFVSADIPLIDLLQAICTCRGLCVQISRVNRDTYRVPFFNVSVRVAKYHQMVNETLALEKNNTPERVWCVTMPKGTIVTRRCGRVAILGNCGFDHPALDTIILARPTMSLALYYQAVGRAIRPYPGKDGWVIDLCGSVSKFGKVEDLWLDHDERGGWIITSNGKQLTNIIMTK